MPGRGAGSQATVKLPPGGSYNGSL